MNQFFFKFSVFEAAKKLNEIKGLKGLDRYFKQIAQSARTNKAERDAHVDDFLGSLNVRLDDIPSNGVERWYELEGKSEKSKVTGSIRLRLKLATREDRGAQNKEENEEENWIELKQQEQLISIFIDNEIARLNHKSLDWNGTFSQEAETILHQHAIQGDLTDFQIALCRWIAFSKKHIEKELSYRVLSDRLEDLNRIFKSMSTSREETNALRDSFDIFVRYCYNIISNLREVYFFNEKHGCEKLQQILRTLSKIFNMAAYKYCFPFQNTLLHELVSLIKARIYSFFLIEME